MGQKRSVFEESGVEETAINSFFFFSKFNTFRMYNTAMFLNIYITASATPEIIIKGQRNF